MPKPAPSRCLTWHFPLPRTHTGILQGNGVQGLMIWGTETLNITVARAGFWDRRGGNPFETRATFSDVRRLLEANNEAGIRELFAGPPRGDGQPNRPQQLGGGRLELIFRKGVHPSRGTLDLATATVTVTLAGADGVCGHVVLRQAAQAEITWIDLDRAANAALKSIRLVPAWEHCRTALEAVGVTAPDGWQHRHGGGFCQSLPKDDPLAVGWTRDGGRIALATALGPKAREAVECTLATDRKQALAATEAWWANYWRDVPRLHLPDPDLQFTYDYGVYKQAGLTPDHGVPATLQGPWMEEYQLPPWSNDYHFNINVQMVYWPCLATNRTQHLQPLWALLHSWLPRLRRNAAQFFGRDDALMLPHAVDDHCQVVGTFWTGTIDHACTAWMAQLAWLHYRYSMDAAVLRETAWPLLIGAFNGYWAMLEEIDEAGGRRWSLPVSVSPEYGGAGMGAWGRDASFQMAALHAICAILPQAALALGESVDPRWADVQSRLPPYTLANPQTSTAGDAAAGRIALWKGQDLTESHRHHSHLGSLYPFCTVDPFDPAHHAVVARSLTHWNTMGAGQWTGWCIPWAAILCARCDLSDAAVNWLRFWRMNFTNEGHGTLHNADFPGCTAWADDALGTADFRKSPGFREVMQMDAGMGAVTAVLELLVQNRHDGIHVLPRIPRGWRELTFDGIRTEGAFLLGATVREGCVREVRILSTAGGPLHLTHGIAGAWTLDGRKRTGACLAVPRTRPGQVLTLKAAP
jgi:alpha-L-fucosidase 2